MHVPYSTDLAIHAQDMAVVGSELNMVMHFCVHACNKVFPGT